ncbi:MAG: phosphoribosylglycinamide formyltransferase, partial [Bacteroidota bacterium]|nr:phosphoribosylglycinamide formyltransferase [Kiloniellaceae bacterium]
MAKTLRVGALISGRGSNLKSLLDACAAPGFPAEIVTVLANRPGAGGLDHARAAGVPAAAIDHKDFPGREAFEGAVTAALEAAGVELVCLAGFMRVVTPGFVRHWQGRMINIHPSLLPLFPGLDTHARALAAGVKLHGCTVHYVSEEVDGGPIIGQAAVPVLPGDEAECLAARVLRAE